MHCIIDNMAASAHYAAEQPTGMVYSVIDAKGKKKKNKNFTIEEENLIQSLVEENHEIINSKFCNEITNRKKQLIWQNIADRINSLGVSCRTTNQIKEKWGNMTKKAKKTFTDYRLSQRKTGGGPPPTEVSQATNNIIDMMKDSASFQGVPGGIDVQITPSTSNDLLKPEENSPPPSSTQTVPALHVADEAPGTSSQPDLLKENTDVLIDVHEMPCTSNSPPRKKRKSKKSVTTTQDDVLEMQYRVLQGQLEQQETEKERNRLQSHKLRLQIKLLEKMIENQYTALPESMDINQLYLSLLDN